MLNKSILGQSFDPFVSKQLDTRTKLLSQDSREDLKGIQYALAKTGFIRLTSSVNIEDENLAIFLGKKEWKGPGLAKAFILQGGTLNNGGLRGGFSGPNSPYTVGSGQLGELGLKPMPGITSAYVISRGRWGSLRDATVNIKCFDRNQLSIIELLYLRPGYTVLLEWGHTLSYDNNEKQINNINFVDFFAYTNKNVVYKNILEKREKYAGNYDGFVGPIMNFSTRENSDGSYDCTMKAVSWGQIIESIKINTSTSTNSSNTKITNDLVGPPSLQQTFKGLQTDINNEILNNSKLETILKTFTDECSKDKKFQNKNILIPNSYQKYFDTDPKGHALNDESPDVDVNTLTTLVNIAFKKSSVNNIAQNVDPDSIIYISLGSLLSIMSRNCLLYTTNTDDEKLSDKSVPIININFNPLTSFCYSPENHVSIDPNICVIRYNGSNLKSLGLDETITNSNINKILPQFKKSDNSTVGYTMNIMLNLNYILDKLSVLKDNNGEVNLYDFLNNILVDVNLSLGRVNDFNITIDDETNTLSIFDNQILENSPKELTLINTLGLKSSLRDIWINSNINNNVASLIAIGAQASGTGAGLDGSILAEYNRGIIDRIVRNRKTSDNLTLNLGDYIKSLENDDRAQSIKQYIENIYINNRIILDDIGQNKLFYADILNTIKSKDKRSVAIIPFTYNIKMDGLSGIKYGQLFSVESTRLPKSYINLNNRNLPSIAFLVTGIEHSIESNSWTTTISGQMAPIREGLTIKK